MSETNSTDRLCAVATATGVDPRRCINLCLPYSRPTGCQEPVRTARRCLPFVVRREKPRSSLGTTRPVPSAEIFKLLYYFFASRRPRVNRYVAVHIADLRRRHPAGAGLRLGRNPHRPASVQGSICVRICPGIVCKGTACRPFPPLPPWKECRRLEVIVSRGLAGVA